MSDYAPGLPSRSDMGHADKLRVGQMLDYIVQKHQAERAGLHHDIRFGDEDMGLLSWAARKGVPAPGEKHLAVQQPVHRYGYKDFEGNIESGYGKGTVKKHDQGQVLITKVTPESIHFTTAHQRHPERFTLARPKGWDRNWLLMNTTPRDEVPYEKVRYKKIPADQVEPHLKAMQEGDTAEAKVDGASQLVQLAKGHAELLSFRTSKTTGRPIFHTERFFGGRPDIPVPKHLEGSILKGEMYASHGGKVGTPQDVGTLTNSSIARSLQLQKERGLQLKNMLYDVQQYGRKPIDPAVTPRNERRKMLEEIAGHLPKDKFHVSEEARDPEAATKLWDMVRTGQHPLTQEGLVFHPHQGVPSKAKLMSENDVVLRETFPGKGKRQSTIGGFRYSHTPEGPIVGKVGTGFSNDFLNEVTRDPSAYIGRVARLRSQQMLPSTALRAPSFIGLHEDINAPEQANGSPSFKMARPAKVASVQQLGEHEVPVSEPGASRLSPLWRPGDHGRSPVDGLHQLLRRHGGMSQESQPGAAGEQQGIQPGQLLLGDAKTTEPQQAGQPPGYVQGQDANHGRVGGADTDRSGHVTGQAQRGVVGRRGGDPSGPFGVSRQDVQPRRPDHVGFGLGEARRDTGDNATQATTPMDIRGSDHTTASPSQEPIGPYENINKLAATVKVWDKPLRRPAMACTDPRRVAMAKLARFFSFSDPQVGNILGVPNDELDDPRRPPPASSVFDVPQDMPDIHAFKHRRRIPPLPWTESLRQVLMGDSNAVIPDIIKNIEEDQGLLVKGGGDEWHSEITPIPSPAPKLPPIAMPKGPATNPLPSYPQYRQPFKAPAPPPKPAPPPLPASPTGNALGQLAARPSLPPMPTGRAGPATAKLQTLLAASPNAADALERNLHGFVPRTNLTLAARKAGYPADPSAAPASAVALMGQTHQHQLPPINLENAPTMHGEYYPGRGDMRVSDPRPWTGVGPPPPRAPFMQRLGQSAMDQLTLNRLSLIRHEAEHGLQDVPMSKNFGMLSTRSTESSPEFKAFFRNLQDWSNAKEIPASLGDLPYIAQAHKLETGQPLNAPVEVAPGITHDADWMARQAERYGMFGDSPGARQLSTQTGQPYQGNRTTTELLATQAGQAYLRRLLAAHTQAAAGLEKQNQYKKAEIPRGPEDEYCPHCDARQERGDDGFCNRCGKPWPEPRRSKKADAHPALADLKKAKFESDRKNYPAKHQILSKLLDEPGAFVQDSTKGRMVGLTHPATGFKIHAPAHVVRGRATQAFTYVPADMKEQILREGLYSSKALLRRPDLFAAVAKSRGEDPEQWRSDIKERLKGWKPESSQGPSVLFHEPPDVSALPENHPLKRWPLARINVDLDAIMKNRPKSTRVHGVELAPYDEAAYNADPEGYPHKRHHDLTTDEIKEIAGRSPADVWAKFKDTEGRGLYAGDVPHAAVITRGGVIPPRYLKAAATLPRAIQDLQAQMELVGSRGRARRYGRPEPEGADYDYAAFVGPGSERDQYMDLMKRLRSAQSFAYPDTGSEGISYRGADYTVHPPERRSAIDEAWALQEQGVPKNEAWARVGKKAVQEELDPLEKKKKFNPAAIKTRSTRSNARRADRAPEVRIPHWMDQLGIRKAPAIKQADVLADMQPYQRRVAKRVAEGDNLLVYHGLGSGKTRSAIAAAEGVGGPYAAVVPASLRENFMGEAEKWAPGSNPEVLSYTGVGMGKRPTQTPNTIIMDEVQRIRNPASTGSRAAMELAMQSPHRVLLSGTPIVNSPSDLAVPLSILTGDEMSPAAFNKQFVGSRTVSPGLMGWFKGVQPTKVPTIQDERGLERLLEHHVDYQPSRTPEGVKTNDERIEVDLSPEQQDFYKLMWGKLPWTTRWKLSNDYPLSGPEITHLSSFMTGPRQAALSLYPFHSSKDPMHAFQTSSKLQSAMGSLKQTLAQDPRAKALVYSNFIDAGLTPYGAALKAEGIPFGQFHGTMSEEERKQALSDYNEGRSRVLLLGPAAAEGISAKGTQLIQLLDPHWNEARMGQARGRGLRFDSHEGLPPELRDVKIQRFISKMPPPGWLGKLFGEEVKPSADEVLEQQARRKEELNEQFRDVLRRVGSPGYERPWSLFG